MVGHNRELDASSGHHWQAGRQLGEAVKEPFDWHKGSAHGCVHLQNLGGVSKSKDQDSENGQCRVTIAETLQVIQTYLLETLCHENIDRARSVPR